MKRPAVFIDRDGTISEEVGYINHPSRFQLFPFAAAAIKLLNNQGWLAVIITNQAGVARGYFSEAMIQTVHENLRQSLNQSGARVDAIYYCAHHPSVGEPPYRKDCECRKPKPGLIKQAAKDLDIELERSWMIGDRYGDIELAHNAGVHSGLVLSGYGRGEWEHQRDSWRYQPELVAENLLEAITSIIGSAGSQKT